MDIVITGRNVDLDGDIKDYVNKRLMKLDHLNHRITKCEVIVAGERERRNVEIILHSANGRMVVRESSLDVYSSVDNAADNLSRQLRKLHDKSHERRRKNMIGRIMAPVTRLSRLDLVFGRGKKGNIITSDVYADKPMLPEEAKLELDLLGREFITFKNANTGETNVLYRKKDGNFGLIEPKF